ncbi:hypothetical protein ACQQ2Q_14455 [Agrobacterium sp. ES01]|uniref:hypothetical protein n=1 Tax=Agrobacterium sp. ES01 TaxID=3420714 RepID=UPI003D1360F8
MSNADQNRSSAIAAAIILLGAGVALYFLPQLVLWIAEFSPILATIVGGLVILSFFGVFWLRARYKRRHPSQD